MRVDIITIFPELFEQPLNTSIMRLARENLVVEFHIHDLRDYTSDKRHSIDDRPYGGGAGMVMMPEPVFRAVEAVEIKDERPATRILLTPQGEKFNQRLARELSQEKRLLLVCGRYEGFDERIRTGLQAREISIGDYVLTGGELPALVIIDAVVRLIPGAVGKQASVEAESFSEDLLEYPHYTRPEDFRGMKVPEVLLSGNHARIEKWRAEQALQRTIERRPDLLKKLDNSQERNEE
jgi:tRNA (guanine37-N1)-methyltransferase